MGDPEVLEKHDPRVLVLKAVLLAVWIAVSFGTSFFARELNFMVAGWPFGYWFAAQGSVLAFIAIVALYAMIMKRLAPQDSEPTHEAGNG